MRESLAELAIRGRVHPHTGEPIVPVGFRKSGAPIWPIMGAAPDDDEGGDGTDDSEDTDEGDDEDEGDEDEDDDEAKEEAERKRKANAESKRHRIENKRLKKQLDEQDSKLKEFEDKDKDELTKASESAKELAAKNEKAEERIAGLVLENAFLSSNTISWHDPKAALKLADLSEVEVDEDGDVTGLDEALKKLAKAKPYLVKSEKDDDDDEEEVKKPPAGTGPRITKTKAAKNREALVKKYPALGRG